MTQWKHLHTFIYIFILYLKVACNPECGRSLTSGFRQPRHQNASTSEGRIINGKKSLKGAWPWQVSLQLLHPKFGLVGHWCGGVLIEPMWVLTAAHCINNELFNLPLAALWTAVLGEWDRDVPENTELHIPVDLIVMHERYHNYQNDIAMMKLSRPVHFSAVCLPKVITAYNLYPEKSNTLEATPEGVEELLSRNPGTKRRPKKLHSSWTLMQTESNKIELGKPMKSNQRKVTQCIATGWGRYTAHGPETATLLQAQVPLLDNSVCQEKYGDNIAIKMGHLCAGMLDGTSGTCVGDSGGPLQCSLQDGRWMLAGITSFGSGCARPGYPDVYTRIAFYIPWIEQQLKKYEDWGVEEEI